MKTNRLRTASVITALAASAMFVACKKDNNTSPTNTNGAGSAYNVYMTDAPSPSYQQVNVNIVAVQVNSSASGWVSLGVHPGIYNLLSLSNGTTVLIANGPVPVGTITQVRLILSQNNNTVVKDGHTYPLQLASEDQSGIKINVNSTLYSGNTFNLTIDFDANMSIEATGSGSYILKPVIRTVNSPNNGGVRGTISPSASAVAIFTISEQGDTAATVSSMINGAFEVQGLAAGKYKLVVMPMAPFTVQTFTDIQVAEGQVSDVGSIVLH